MTVSLLIRLRDDLTLDQYEAFFTHVQDFATTIGEYLTHVQDFAIGEYLLCSDEQPGGRTGGAER